MPGPAVENLEEARDKIKDALVSGLDGPLRSLLRHWLAQESEVDVTSHGDVLEEGWVGNWVNDMLKNATEKEPRSSYVSEAAATAGAPSARSTVAARPDEVAAAVKIQSIHRGRATRAAAKEPTYVSEAAATAGAPSARSTVAARTPDPVSTQRPDEEAAAVKIQSIHRGRASRMAAPRTAAATAATAGAPSARSTVAARPDEAAAAVKIQSIQRGRSSRMAAPGKAAATAGAPSAKSTVAARPDEVAAAVKIQSIQRGRSSRMAAPGTAWTESDGHRGRTADRNAAAKRGTVQGREQGVTVPATGSRTSAGAKAALTEDFAGDSRSGALSGGQGAALGIAVALAPGSESTNEAPIWAAAPPPSPMARSCAGDSTAAVVPSPCGPTPNCGTPNGGTPEQPASPVACGPGASLQIETPVGNASAGELRAPPPSPWTSELPPDSPLITAAPVAPWRYSRQRVAPMDGAMPEAAAEEASAPAGTDDRVSENVEGAASRAAAAPETQVSPSSGTESPGGRRSKKRFSVVPMPPPAGPGPMAPAAESSPAPAAPVPAPEEPAPAPAPAPTQPAPALAVGAPPLDELRDSLRKLLEQGLQSGNLVQLLKKGSAKSEALRARLSELFSSSCQSGRLSAGLNLFKETLADNSRIAPHGLEKDSDDVRSKAREALELAVLDDEGDDVSAKAREALEPAVLDDEGYDFRPTAREAMELAAKARKALEMAMLNHQEEVPEFRAKARESVVMRQSLLIAAPFDAGDDVRAKKREAPELAVLDEEGDDVRAKAREALELAVLDDEGDDVRAKAREALELAVLDDEGDDVRAKAREALELAVLDDEGDDVRSKAREALELAVLDDDGGDVPAKAAEVAVLGDQNEVGSGVRVEPYKMAAYGHCTAQANHAAAGLRLLSAISICDQRVGELRAAVLAAEKRQQELTNLASHLEAEVASNKREAEALQVDIEKQHLALELQFERHCTLEDRRRRLAETLSAEDLKWRHAAVELERNAGAALQLESKRHPYAEYKFWEGAKYRVSAWDENSRAASPPKSVAGIKALDQSMPTSGQPAVV